MARYENWKQTLSDCNAKHTQLHHFLSKPDGHSQGAIHIQISVLEETIEELETKIAEYEKKHGVMPKDAEFGLQVSPNTRKCLESLHQSVETFSDLEMMSTSNLTGARETMDTLNKYRNDLAAFFVVPSGEKIMDSAELKKKYINHTLFDKIASGTRLGVADKEDIENLFSNTDPEKSPYYYRSLITSALTLGLMHNYDVQKVILLINIINQGEPLVWKRALVGLVVGLMDKQDKLNDDIVRRLAGLKEKPSVQKEFYNLAMAFEELEENMVTILIDGLKK